MNIRKSVCILLAVLAIATLVGLLIVPATSWRVRGQISTSLGRYASPFPSSNKQQQLREYPNDYQIHLAAAFWPPKERLPRLRALESRFPNSPSLYAYIAGSAVRDEIRLQRDEAYLYDGHRPPDFSVAPKPASPAQLAAFDREATTGERLDPDNAYFPFMRAIAFFAAHRDQEALASIHRAAMRPRWSDYAEDEVRGDWRLTGNASRSSSAYVRIYDHNLQSFPQYFQVNDVARVAVYLAERDELARHKDAGLAVKLDLLRCAGLMRTQSTSLIGSILGIGIAKTALVWPGGVPHAKDQHLTPGVELIKKRLDAFCDYLAHIGHDEAIGSVTAEIEAGQHAMAISDQAISKGLLTSEYTAYLHWWATDLAACGNVVCLLLLGALAALLTRARQIRAGESMKNHGHWGILSGILLGTAGLVWLSKPLWVSKPAALNKFVPMLFPDSGPYTAPPIAGIAAGFLVCAVIALICLWRTARRERRSLIHALGISLVTAAALLEIGIMANTGAWTLTQLVLMWKTDLWGRGGLSNGMAHVVSVLAVLAVPMGTLFAAGVYSLTRGVPLSVGLVSGVRQAALPTACAVTLIYGGMTVATLRLEEHINDNLEHIVRHEGRYYAARIGQTWPGPTNWTSVPVDGGRRNSKTR